MGYRKSRGYGEGSLVTTGQAAGVTLGPIQSISEQGSRRPPQRVLRRARTLALEAADTVPIARGEHSIVMQVYITWQIK